MACSSPTQYVLALSTTSSSNQDSRPNFMSEDRSDDTGDVDEHEQVETGTDAMLDHVRQLIVDLLVADDNRRGLSFCLDEDVVVEPTASLLSTRDAKDLNKNLEAKEDGDSLARERLLESKLARVLMELAGEQDNLRLAANAGNALLKELGAAREELDVLHDELKAAQIERDQAVRDSQRLWGQNAALETEMQRYDAWDSTGQQNTQQTQQQRRSSLTSFESFGRSDSCKRCASREVEVTQLEQCINELRRRCLELELAREREQQQQRELTEEITQLQQRSKEQSLETLRTQRDLEFMTLQLEQQVEEVESVQAVRDTLHHTARRLKAENKGLQGRLVARDKLVEKLENGKARAATQLQVAENRIMSAEAVTKRITKTLGQLQKQLEHTLQQQQGGRDSKEADVKPCEKESEDIEQLLQDARRKVEVLRLGQRSSEASPNRSRMRGRRRKTLCAGSPETTAADVLALGSREPSKGETASFTSNSESVSDIELSASSNFQLVETIAPTTQASELLSKDGKERRITSSKLSWVDHPSTIIDDTVTAVKQKLGSVLVLREGKHCTMLVDENQVGRVLHQEMESVTASSSVVAHHAVLSRLSHIISYWNNPHVHVSWGDRKKATWLSAIGSTECPRIRELPMEVLGREAIELPPTSPLYLGLSFIACATAATAANFLVRR